MPEECRVACRGEDKRAASYSSEYMPAGAARTLRRAQGSAVARECAHGHRHATHQPTRNHTDRLNRRQVDALGHRLIDFDLDSGSAGRCKGGGWGGYMVLHFCKNFCSVVFVTSLSQYVSQNHKTLLPHPAHIYQLYARGCKLYKYEGVLLT